MGRAWIWSGVIMVGLMSLTAPILAADAPGGIPPAKPAQASAPPSPPVEVTTPAPVVVDSWVVDPHPLTISEKNAGPLAEIFPFNAGGMTFQAMAGYYKKTTWGPGGPGFDYIPLAARLGYMLTSPTDDFGIFRGSIEALVEVNYAPVLEQFGSYFTGPNAILRYNFVQPECLVVPYIQGGGGFVLTDAYKDLQQELIGQEFTFFLRADVGARLMLLENISVDAEVGYQHLSNACLAPRNGGINTMGFSVGMTYYFGK
ncbi:MAG: acyloxyacyl hydrolase [Gemmataceae bacterium]